MKKKITIYTVIVTFIALNPGGFVNAQNLYIPDTIFKAVLVADPSINTNADNEIQVSEAAAYSGTLNVNFKYISDLTGIEAFYNLNTLWCYGNRLTDLDVSSNTALTQLFCGGNLLMSLNVSKNKSLTILNCNNNRLKRLNVSSNSALLNLYCSNNQLTRLNLSSNSSLIRFHCDNNKLTRLDISANTNLIDFDCYRNELTGLNLFTNKSLIYLNCDRNKLTTLDVSGNTALTFLFVEYNQLSNLDISANIELTILYCGGNQFAGLDVSSNKKLTDFVCRENQLTSLDVSANHVLKNLNCGDNQLTSLDVSANKALTLLGCYSNLITGMDISANFNLYSFACYNNQLRYLNLKNGNNTNLSMVLAINNPSLTCIQVDNAGMANASWTNGKDAWASYSEDCTTGVDEIDSEDRLMIYPNPGNGIFTLTTDLINESNVRIEIVDVAGQLVGKRNELKFNANINSIEIDLSDLLNGIYFLKVQNDNYNQTFKVLKNSCN